MFDALSAQAPDALLALIQAFQQDPRAGKIDLGVGVYRDAQGNTPVMRAVKKAEAILHETQESKKYLGPEGDLGFVTLLEPIIFGKADPFGDRLCGIQTPGGTGALRLGADLIAAAKPGATIWVGTPTWPNHQPIFTAAGLTIKTYGYIDLESQRLEFDKMMDALKGAAKGDVVLLHGCCQNPTGIDLSLDQWKDVTALVVEKGLIPFIDLAYQGLGLGLDEDAAGTRMVLEAVDEALVAYSCDKNFGVYRDRVGALYVLSRDGATAVNAMSGMAMLARVSWSMPPDHGAAIVRIVLERPELVAIWKEELLEMCARVNGNRASLASAHPSLAFIRDQRGLFSTLSMAKEQAIALRTNHAVYMANSGRMNIAGMGTDDAEAIVAALKAEGCI
ncbi:amino acid aminotransferase [Agrobacterium sp. ES01]|uniref:amino acid aminotransferase n=1 Tax=Agrobacterium sp. ES01 TaxID=3420714 RepID=UPI003D0BED8B